MAYGYAKKTSNCYVFDWNGENKLLRFEQFSEASGAPDIQISKFVDGSRMVPCSHLYNIIELSY